MSNEPMGEPIEYDGDEEKHLYRRLSQALLEEQEDDEESPLEDDEDPTESTRCDVCGFSRFPRGAIAVIFLAMLESWNQNTIWYCFIQHFSFAAFLISDIILNMHTRSIEVKTRHDVVIGHFSHRLLLEWASRRKT